MKKEATVSAQVKAVADEALSKRAGHIDLGAFCFYAVMVYRGCIAHQIVAGVENLLRNQRAG